ncbi:3-sulfinopropanoyl-CoA desulfinase [Roseobacter sinensis]|uniref:Acyl-CoA dehydrogenase family protein n=1 Tax=Roseobacter sinensis TaxID=2931391 RepID=A0ABT3BCX0_9RHOB|nr:3-sulfinopropanoyl-CoA desulfinase [Roseobacter sp. WL0113]MCV3271405.1 acyl-CoA dehydrogenase family protein [Roseobacter sp. WL0113]
MFDQDLEPTHSLFLDDMETALKARARAFAERVLRPQAVETDRTETYPAAVVSQMAEAGFMGMCVPEDLGGPGLRCADIVLVVEEFARCCGVSGRIAVEGNMGAVGAVLAYGTPEQKEIAARHVLAGDKPAICITEPGAGSAATEMVTTATRHGDAWVLNGMKHWITGGGVSRLHLVFAQVVDDGAPKGIAGFLVFPDDDGFEVGAREPTMGLRGIPETALHFNGIRLPADRLLGPADGPACGFARLMDAYNAQRVGAATVALGLAQSAFESACAHVKSRQQFGRPLAEFQGLQWMLADMATQIDAARLMIWRAAKSAEQRASGFPDPMLAAQAKVFASEMAVKVTNDALQLHGASGYSRNAPIERIVRDARMFTIGGGTAQMLRNLIAGKVLDMKTPQTRAGYLTQ